MKKSKCCNTEVHKQEAGNYFCSHCISICEDDYEEAEKCAKLDLEDFKQSLQKKQFPSSVELTEDLKVIKWYYEK
jgi:hypothetical protein